MRLAVVFGLSLLLAACDKTKPSVAASASEAKAYIANLGLSDFEMKAAESFGGQQLVEITGKISNKGARGLQRVDLTCIFYDPFGQPILRETVPIVRADKGGLPAGETKPYRLPFDTIPANWNNRPPQMVMAGLVFE